MSIVPFIIMSVVSVAAGAYEPYLVPMAESYIARGVKTGFGYGEATLYTGIEAAYALCEDEEIAEWYHEQIDAVVLGDGSIVNWDLGSYSLDNYRIGNNILWWYERTGNDKYKAASEVIREQLNRHPRTPSGGFWHRQPAYPNQMWLDGIFMADSFYSKWTSLFNNDNATAWDDIVLQYDLIEEHCRDATSGLLFHGYDESGVASWADPETGASPLVWSRAVGWYFMSLLETISVFPQTHSGYDRLLGYFTTLAQALKEDQDSSGGWWLVMTEPYAGREGNYIESSASAMFTFGLLRGIRLGLLTEEFSTPAKAAYAALVDSFVSKNDDGTLNWEGTVQVGSLSSNASYEYYIGVPVVQNDNRGGGSFLVAAYEWETRS